MERQMQPRLEKKSKFVDEVTTKIFTRSLIIIIRSVNISRSIVWTRDEERFGCKFISEGGLNDNGKDGFIRENEI